jgi:hypothetical protein
MLSRRLFLAIPALPVALKADDAAWILKLGGQIRRDSSGEVVDVNLRGRWVSAAEILDLLQYKKMVRLNLSLTSIKDPDILYLRPAVQIEDLNVAYAEHLTDIGLNVIKDWMNLRRLNISGTQAGVATMSLLGRLTRMESLDVAGSDVPDDALQELLPLTNLKHLGLGRSSLTEGAIEVLSLLDNLQSLDLSRPSDRRSRRRGASDRMAPALVEAIAKLRDLRILRVGHSEIDAAAVRVWASSLEKLERLGLESCTRIDDSVAATVAEWKSLKQLDLQATRVTSAGLDEIRKRRPDVRVLASPTVT